MEEMTERKPHGMPMETWVEGQIAQSIARGEFQDLAGAEPEHRHRRHHK